MRLKQQKKTQLEAAPAAMIGALLYRIPQAVTEVRMYGGGSSYPVCPTCRSSLDREYMAFCDRCGQRLDWEEFDVTTDGDCG